MGKKGSWFSALKRALSFESKNKCFGKYEDSDPDPVPSSQKPEINVPAPPPPVEDVKLIEVENEQNKHAQSVALATAAAAEVAIVAAQAAAEVVRLTSAARYSGKSEEEIAAIKIQTAFRGYLARRALRALRGLVRLRSLIHGQSVKRQATTTLRCMQTLARVQSQIRARRIRMSEENQALQRQLQQKNEKELEKLRCSVTIGDDWNDSTQSKEQIEAKLQSKQEAAMRRERALAYSFSHQQTWKNSSKSATPTFMDPNNPHWGWSWLERWMASRPWENQSTAQYNDQASLKSAASRAASLGEISKSYSRRDNNSSPTAQKPSLASKAPPLSSKMKPPSPKGSSWGGDDDSRSMLSAQSERYRRHSIAGSSVRDDNDNESMPNSPSSVPSYMVPTKSAKAKSRLPSPLGVDHNAATPEKSSGGSAKKRLSFSASPAGPRRHSGPPNLDSSPINKIGVVGENM